MEVDFLSWLPSRSWLGGREPTAAPVAALATKPVIDALVEGGLVAAAVPWLALAAAACTAAVETVVLEDAAIAENTGIAPAMTAPVAGGRFGVDLFSGLQFRPSVALAIAPVEGGLVAAAVLWLAFAEAAGAPAAAVLEGGLQLRLVLRLL